MEEPPIDELPIEDPLRDSVPIELLEPVVLEPVVPALGAVALEPVDPVVDEAGSLAANTKGDEASAIAQSAAAIGVLRSSI